MTPAFSVIIPVYNGAATLARAVDSVLAQHWPVHEVIIVDDGSTDATAAVARGYGDRVRYVRQDNAGVSAARNQGARLATGDWLAFLDADDWYYPDRLKCHAEWIAVDPTLDFLTGDYDYRRPDGSRISGSMEIHPAGGQMLRKADGAERVVMVAEELESFVADHFGDTHTLSVPRQRFIELGGYPTGYRVCEDVFFLVRLCAVSQRIGVVCQPMAAYLIHEGSATRKNPLQAQRDNVTTLRALLGLSGRFSNPIRRGIASRMRNARQDLGSALLRAGQRWAAVKAVTPTVVEGSVLAGLRDMVSMVKG